MARQRVSLQNGTSKGVVLDLIRTRGPISRVQLAEATGLTQVTMSTVVRQLMTDGLVVESGRGKPTGGRVAMMLAINPVSRFAVGIRLGGRSVTCVVINLVGGIVGRARTTDVGSVEPQELVDLIADEIEGILSGLGIGKEKVVGVGIAAPGPLDVSRGLILAPPHMAAWHNVPIRSMLAEAIALPVLLDNDATAAAIGDFWGGSISGSVSHATVYMGPGIGSGVLVDGMVFRGASSNAGELGQLYVPTSDGQQRTLESVADPAAVVARAKTLGTEVAHLDLGDQDDFESFTKIAQAAVHGDALAASLIEESAEYMAMAVVGMANLFDLDSITLSGPAFAIAGPVYVLAITRRLEEGFLARAQHGISVRLSIYLSDSAAVGAAAIVLQTFLAPRNMGFTEVTAMALP